MKYQLVLVLLYIINVVKMQQDTNSYPYSLVNATNMQVYLNNSVLNNILNEFVQQIDGQKITQNASYVIINLNNSFQNPMFTFSFEKSASELTLTNNQNFDILVQVNSTFRQKITNVTLNQIKIQFNNYFGDLQMNCTSLKFNYNSSLFSTPMNSQVNELQNSLNNQFIKLINNWKGKRPQITNIENYDFGIFYSQNDEPSFKNNGMILNMGNLIVHNYQKVSRNTVDQFLSKHPCSDNKCDCQNQNSMFISEKMMNTYFQSAFDNNAFKISMKSSQIQLWLQWLGVNINNIDIGFIKTLYPSSDTELDDSTLLDLDFQANDVPVIEFGNDFLQSNLQFTLSFNNQGVKVMSINCAIKVFFMFQLDQNNILNIQDIQFMIKTLQIVNEDGKLELQSQGLTQVASAILQVIAPAIIKNTNLNGVNLNSIFGFNTFRFIQPQITSIRLINDYIAVFFDPKESKFNAQDFINSISKEQN